MCGGIIGLRRNQDILGEKRSFNKL